MTNKSLDKIIIKGARVHNLKNVSLELPKNSLIVFTGISGSGKSSLAFDTIFAEGQRRYVESMSTYARQFLGVMEKPDIDEINNLSPVLSIDQKTSILSPRSTVGTMSDIYDYIRLLFSTIGTPGCPVCGKSMQKINFEKKKDESRSIRKWQCIEDKMTYPEISISHFSFNSPAGACLVCRGLGEHLVVDPELIMPNPNLTIDEGAIRPFSRINSGYSWFLREISKPGFNKKIRTDIPIGKLSKQTIHLILSGEQGVFEGIVNYLTRRYNETDSDYLQKEISKYMLKKICPECNGARLKKEVLSIKVGGYSIVELVKLPLSELKEVINNLTKSNCLNETDKQISHQLLAEILKRIQFLIDVGLSYLTLDRSAATLAGGEAQRIRLASQLGSGLVGIVYILDEPSIGLHPKDHDKLLAAIRGLKNIGNTVIVVEHDRKTIEQADWIVDVGPGAGQKGGNIVASGTLEDIKNSSQSITGKYLTNRLKIKIPEKRRAGNGADITIRGARQFNLKNINVHIPLGKLVVVTGVSGSGKSTLITDILASRMVNHFYRGNKQVGDHDEITGLDNVSKVIVVDQSPIGRNVRSNPATYTGILTPLRRIFSDLPEAKKKRFGANCFSFNLKGGRCELCKGDGLLRFEMHFLPNVMITCEVCQGKRYTKEVLEILLSGKSIADILDMTVEEGLIFFKDYRQIKDKLTVLKEVGLGYLRLGQPATMLSGGEAQRIKLATELSRSSNGNTLYILDEPTTGLHFDDINRLLKVLHRLVDIGNSVLIIEHNLDVVKNADWIIDLGPDGGKNGGELIVEGTPEKVTSFNKGFTSKYLKEVL